MRANYLASGGKEKKITQMEGALKKHGDKEMFWERNAMIEKM